MRKELQAEPTDWDEIYYTFQSSGVSDSRWHSKNFDSQPVIHIAKQLESIHKRDQNLANYHSISVSRLGLVMASGDKLTLDDFLPFPLEDSEAEKKSVISKETAQVFIQGVKDKIIAPKLIGAFSKYMDEILSLSD